MSLATILGAAGGLIVLVGVAFVILLLISGWGSERRNQTAKAVRLAAMLIAAVVVLYAAIAVAQHGVPFY